LTREWGEMKNYWGVVGPRRTEDLGGGFDKIALTPPGEVRKKKRTAFPA